MLYTKEFQWKVDVNICNCINLYPDVKLLILSGPSGCGKTALAKYIVNRYSRYKVIKNYTTRKKREDDIEGHFEYLSEDEFNEKLGKNDFFMARTNIRPFYAYSGQDINELLDDNIIPIFMFRHSGLECLSKIIINMFVVFIDCGVNESILHTHDIEGTTSREIAGETLKFNRKIFESSNKRIEKIWIENNFTSAFFNNKTLNDELSRIEELCLT